MVNKIFLLGRMGKDPVVKNFDNGGKIAEFTVATDDSYKDKQGDKVEQTDWHNVKVSGKLADVAEKYLKKGSLIHVEGKVKTRSYDDKDGNKRYVTEVVCESFKMLGDKKDSGNSDYTAPATKKDEEFNGNKQGADDDLPFVLLALIGMGSLLSLSVV